LPGQITFFFGAFGMAPEFRSGFAALVGRPNVGKSTLLNALVGERLAIVSPKPQTTRTRILGVVTRESGQLAFLDTPGVHEAKGALNRFMVETALTAAAECDVVLFMIEPGALKAEVPPEVSPGNRVVLERLKALNKPTILVINKIDEVVKPLLLPLIARYREEFPFAEIVPISARKGDGVDGLFDLVLGHMPVAEAMYPPDVFTDQAERDLVSEYVREQVLKNCRQEIPYSTAVVVEVFDESERAPKGPPRKQKGKGPALAGLVRIHANIFVERDSQKAIIIGKKGAMLKAIGTEARKAIQRLLGTHIFLSLQVKVEPRWSERPETLRRMGYSNVR
jgi:GTP-binding protein Era